MSVGQWMVATGKKNPTQQQTKANKKNDNHNNRVSIQPIFPNLGRYSVPFFHRDEKKWDHLKVTKVLGNGDCGLLSVLYLTDPRASSSSVIAFRTKIMDVVSKDENLQTFKFINNETPLEYVIRMRKPKEWIGPLELSAMAQIYGGLIIVYEIGRDRDFYLTHSYPCEQPTKPTLELVHESGNHFNPIIVPSSSKTLKLSEGKRCLTQIYICLIITDLNHFF